MPEKLGPGRQIVSQDNPGGVSRIGGQAGTQAPDPTPVPPQTGEAGPEALPTSSLPNRGAAELRDTGADQESQLVAAAQALMSLVDEAGTRAGKYTVDMRGAQGAQIGDHNTQRNIFGAPPGG